MKSKSPSCGLFAAMFDIFFVSAPPKPTTAFDAKVNGTFNQWVQNAFNKAIPPDLSKTLSLGNTIGSADASTGAAFVVNAGKMYVTRNILNANYAFWMGFAWNSFHLLKWGMWDRQNKLWDGILNSEVKEIDNIISKIRPLHNY